MRVKVWYDVETGSGSQGVVETSEIVECDNVEVFGKGNPCVKCTVTKPLDFNPYNQATKKLFKKFNRFEILDRS